MLKHLQIKNLALVKEQSVEFHLGLNIITGETGAGKSVIMGAMRLLMGQRADKNIIRHGEEKAELCAFLRIPEVLIKKIKLITDAQEIDWDDSNEIILRRVISKSSSRNFINGVAVPLQTLKALGSQLIDIFAAGEQHSLAESAKQLSILDRFMKQTKELNTLADKFNTWKDLQQQLDTLMSDIPNPGELDILRFQQQEIEDAKIQLDEEEQLYENFNRAASGRERFELSQQLTYLMDDEQQGCINSLRQALASAQDLNRLDSDANEFSSRLESLLAELNDLSMECANYNSSITLDPEELHRLEERMQTYNSIKRKYGPELSDTLDYYEKISGKIALADGYEQQVSQLKDDIQSAEQAFNSQALKVRELRKKAAKKLAKAITQELTELEFMNCDFRIAVEEAKANPKGLDQAHFYFAPNIGEQAKLLSDIASSGEISRVMLAVKSVLAEIDAIPILIFDEIDANIGGITASKIAKKLFSLGQNRQLFCVTHLPQVAAAGHKHYRVEKKEEAGRSLTHICELSKNEQVEEIGRMLGGEETSSLVYAHASELVQSIQA